MTREYRTARERLISEATVLKRAWVMAYAWLGRAFPDSYSDALVPEFRDWPRRRLEKYVRDLRDDVEPLLRHILGPKRTRSVEQKLVAFLSSAYPDFLTATEPYSLC